MNLNPKKWFSRKAKGGGVYVCVKLDGYFQGISETEPATGAKPYILFKDLTLAQAAMEIPGKAFDWHSVPMWVRERLEIDPWCLVTEWSRMKAWIR